MIGGHYGAGAISVDLGAQSGRWDVGIRPSSEHGFEFLAWDSVVPDAGRRFPMTTSRTPLLQLVYEPSRKTARLLADGHSVMGGYRGHQQFLEGYGLFFGASNLAGAATRGEMDYFVAMLEIR